jgi:predicted cupin superfamily sugar epimerase
MTELPDWARPLDLAPNPEGGWFRLTWRSDLTVSQSALPPDYTGPRSAGSAILLLMMPGQQSAWHTVRSAELWLHHRGSPLLLELGADDPARQHMCSAPTSSPVSDRRSWCPLDTGSGHALAMTSRAW